MHPKHLLAVYYKNTGSENGGKLSIKTQCMSAFLNMLCYGHFCKDRRKCLDQLQIVDSVNRYVWNLFKVKNKEADKTLLGTVFLSLRNTTFSILIPSSSFLFPLLGFESLFVLFGNWRFWWKKFIADKLFTFFRKNLKV